MVALRGRREDWRGADTGDADVVRMGLLKAGCVALGVVMVLWLWLWL